MSLENEVSLAEENTVARKRMPWLRHAWLWLALLLVFHVGMNLWWLQADNHPVNYDEETHMTMARNYYEAFTDSKNANLLERLVSVSRVPLEYPAHPPFLHAVGAGMIALFGYNVDIIAFSNTLAFVLLLLGCYAFGRRFLDPWQALFCVFVVSFTPVVFAASRFFMTDYAAGAMVVWILYALLRSDSYQRTGWVFLFAVLNGLAILTRTVTPLYYILPAALVALTGLFKSLGAWKREGASPLGRLLLHVCMTLVVSIGIFAPWYYQKLDVYYTYWNKYKVEGSGVMSSAPEVEAKLPEASAVPAALRMNQGAWTGSSDTPPAAEGETAPPPPPAAVSSPSSEGAVTPPAAAPTTSAEGAVTPPAPAPAPEAVAPSPASDWVAAWTKKIQEPDVPWALYPIFVLDNNTFLVLFVLGALGIPLALVLRRYRGLPAVMLVLSVLGFWVLFSLLFRFGNPRYAIPVTALFSMLAAMTLLAVPGRRLRTGLMALVSILLVVQYVNLSVHSLGSLSVVEFPITLPEKLQQLSYEKSLVLWKNRLTPGNSYAEIAPPTRENFRDKLLLALCAEENQRKDFVSGPWANYLKIDLLGMELHQRHFWPEPNAFQRQDIDKQWLPKRRLWSVALVKSPEQGESLYHLVDYVLYSVPKGEEAKETAWLDYLGQRGFRAITRFEEPGYGRFGAKVYGALARDIAKNMTVIKSAEDIKALNTEALYQLIHQPGFASLAAELQQQARQRFDNEMKALNANPLPISEILSFAGAKMEPDKTPGWLTFIMYFRVEKEVPEGQRIAFRGQVPPEAATLLEGPERATGWQIWDFDPEPAMNTWKPGEYVMLSRRIRVFPVPYQFICGVSDTDGKVISQMISLGKYDFTGTMPMPAQK